MSTTSQTPACGCPPPPFPAPTANPPGQAAITYRIGDFLAFRRALLKPLAGEVELKDWVPKPDGDLALQMVDWWAYIADVLTFYGERIANESYLRTAQLPESVAHLAQTLGYRPRPAIGARGQVAGLIASGARTPVVVPQGTQIQSKGSPPQVFEVDRDTKVIAPDIVVADVVPARSPLLGTEGSGQVAWLAGKVSGIKPSEHLLLIATTALRGGSASPFAWISVTSATPKKDPLGADVTQVAFTVVSGALADDLSSQDFALLRPRQNSPLWTYPAGSADVVTTSSLELAGLARGLNAGALMLIEVAPGFSIFRFDDKFSWQVPSAGFPLAESAIKSADHRARFQPSPSVDAPRMGSVSGRGPTADSYIHVGGTEVILLPFQTTPRIVESYAESVWYANGKGPSAPDLPAAPIGMMHGKVTFGEITSGSAPSASRVTVRWDWLPVGALVPVLNADDYTTAKSNIVSVDPVSKRGFPTNVATAMLEDKDGVADTALVTPNGAEAALTGLSQTLATPIDLLFDFISVSRGKTVKSEILGSGDTRVAGQDFALAKSPVTYFSDPKSVSGDQFSSTVTVWVNGVAWTEVRTFCGAGPTDQIYVLREDDQGVTHVQFGDGINGGRLPTGVGNIVASYRYGAGGTTPDPQTLTTVIAPVPGLKGVRNPLPPTGGADPDPPSRIRTLAPASVLTLNRVVSLDDFAATALTAGGVTKAFAAFAIDPVSQRPKITVYVAGDAGAVASARNALEGAGASMSGVVVLPALPVTAFITVSYLRDPRYVDADVSQRLRIALGDPDAGLLGANALGIGQAIYDSQIAAACLAVAGVVSVAAIGFRTITSTTFARNFRYHWYLPIKPRPTMPSLRHDPGQGRYFSIPDDSQHIVLAGSAAP